MFVQNLKIKNYYHYHYIIDEFWLTKSIMATHLDPISKFNPTYMINGAKMGSDDQDLNTKFHG